MRRGQQSGALAAIPLVVLTGGVASAQGHGRHGRTPIVIPPPPPPGVPAAGQPVAPPAPPPPPVAKAAPHWHPRPKEAAPAGPLPDIRMVLDAPSRLGPWTLHVTNRGEVPVRLVADARLLVLDVTPRSAARAVRCELPADMRPADDMDGALVLPPGRSYAETFEPRLFCFGTRLLDALSAGAVVVGHLGWTGAPARGPYAVQALDGVEPVVAPRKAVDSPPVALPDDPTPPPAADAASRPDDPDPARFTLRGPAAIDAPSASTIGVNLTLHNAGKRPVTVRFRPETLGFRVAGPAGVQDCRWPLSPVAPMRELFTTVRADASADLSVLLA
ncbi:MAG TPA: hypothetical protein VIF09_24665, partial [Polyangiaceae bacterium]